MGTWSSGMIPRLGRGGRGFDSRSPPFAPRGNERRLAHRRARQAGDATRRRKGSKVERLFSSVPCSGESFFQAEKNTKKKKKNSTRAFDTRTFPAASSHEGFEQVRWARRRRPCVAAAKKRGIGGIEPPTSSTRRTNHATRPNPQPGTFPVRGSRSSHSDFGVGINPSFLG